MTGSVQRRVSVILAFFLAVVLVFCLIAAAFPYNPRLSALPYAEAEWSDGWRAADGETLRLPSKLSSDGAPVTLEKTLPDSLAPNAVLVVSSSYLPVRAMADGREFTVHGTFLPGAFGLSYANSYSAVSLPPDAAGRTLRLTLYPGGSKTDMELYGMRLGDQRLIDAYYLEQSQLINALGMVALAISAVLLLTGLLLKILRVWQIDSYLIPIGFFILLSTSWILLDIGANVIRYGQNGAYLFVNLFAFMLMGLPIQVLARKICDSGRNVLAGLVALYVVVPLSIAVLAWLGWFQLSVALKASHALFILTLCADSFYLLYDQVKKKNRSARLLIVGLFTLMLTGGATFVNFYCFCSPDNTSYFRWGVAAFSLLLLVWAVRLIITCMADAQSVGKLRYAANHDPLTGLYNKNAFYERVATVLQRDRLRPYAIGCFDFERFKLVNEVLGREQGDKVLRYTADCLRARMSPKDAYARLESDKFLLMIRYAPEAVKALCEGLQADIDRYPVDFSLALSFGWYIDNSRTLSPEAMADRASIARAEIKGVYLERISFYDDRLRQKVLYEQSIVNQMEAALRLNQFQLYLQFKYDLRTSHINGAEALVRWNHPTQGLLSPGAFIPILEKNGLILRLDEFIWRRACDTLRRWMNALGPERTPTISVNVSRFNLYNPNLAHTLRGIVDEYGVPPGHLVLEITESVYANDQNTLLKIADSLHASGFSVHMDDFGSGYSSLNMLKDINVDAIKIDMKFLSDTKNPEKGFGIINAVIDMAKVLHIYMIAEGVETKEQADRLRGAGCLGAQGYYFHRPVDAESATRMLLEQR